MATLTQVTTVHSQSHSLTTNWLDAYQLFIANAQFCRVGWAATALIIQGCLLSPTLLLTMFTFGGGDWQLLTSNLCFLLVLILFCSAMNVKYILPAFVFSFFVHLAIILMNVL
jgi:hypothetical protein